VSTSGWIRNSVGFARKDAHGNKSIVQCSLGAALGLSPGDKTFYIFRDTTGGLEYLRNGHELCDKGLFVQLDAYGCHVFGDWREVHDTAGLYARLNEKLGGGGVQSVEIALRELLLEPLRRAFMPLIEDNLWRAVLPASTTPVVDSSRKSEVEDEKVATAPAVAPTVEMWDAYEAKLRAFGAVTRDFCGLSGNEDRFASQTRARLERVAAHLSQAVSGETSKLNGTLLNGTSNGTASKEAESSVETDLPVEEDAMPAALWSWGLLSQLGLLSNDGDVAARSREWIDEWLLASLVEDGLRRAGQSGDVARRGVQLSKLLTAHATPEQRAPFALASALLSDEGAREMLGINRFEGVTWFDQDGFSLALERLQRAALIEGATIPVAQLQTLAESSGYRVVKLLELARVQEKSLANGDTKLKAPAKKRAPAKAKASTKAASS
jgi:hypothetical protein